MKISNQLNAISFQKRLVAKACISTKDNEQKDVNLYHLDDKSDIIDLVKATESKDWNDAFYLEEALICFPELHKDSRYYTMEDENHNIICYSIFDERDTGQNKLSCIETMPAQSCYADFKRKFKYVGETMIAFLAKLTKQDDKNFLVGSIASRPKTQHFYFDQCGFKPCGKMDGIMETSKLDNLIFLNGKHTNSKIEILV